MIKIQPLKKSTAAIARDLNALMPQLSASGAAAAPRISPAILRRLLANKNLYIALVLDGKKVVGTGAIVFMTTLLSKSAIIEDVIIDSGYRGRGLGEKLMRHLLEIAKAKKVATVDLTSKPARVAANKLYQKLAFELRDTNVYRKKLK